MSDKIFGHTMQAFELMFGEELEGRESLEVKALQRFDPVCPLCFKHEPDCIHCDWCIEIGHLCDICEGVQPLEGESQDAYDSRMAGVPRYGEL